MLYGIERKSVKKEDVVDELRRRGIAFALTDGIRGLTRSKAANDDDLKRALEEAERRRKNPEATKLPTELEVAGIIDKTRRKTLDAVEEMPDFVVKQQIQRSVGYAGTGTFRNQDKLVVGVSYRSTGEESYKLLSINGAIQANPEAKGGYSEAGGTSSTGEFVTMLATIFKPENEADFVPVQTDIIRGRKSTSVAASQSMWNLPRAGVEPVGYSFCFSGTATILESRGASTTARMRVLPCLDGLFETRCRQPVGS